MKNPRALLMIAFSLLAGAAAVLLAAKWLGARASAATQEVVVAAKDLDLGTALDASMLQVVGWPSASVPEGAVSDPKSLDVRVIRTTVLRGEPILEAKLAPVGTKGGLSAVIPEGKRAITVKVNEVIGVAGFALPGNYVDVMVNTRDDREDKPVSMIVLEHILVLAVAQEASRDATRPKVVNAVTLEVTPEQAEKLDLARSVGQLSLALRNQVDKAPTVTAGVRKADLLRSAAAPATVRAPAVLASAKGRTPPAAAAPGKDKVEIIRGMQKSTAEL